MQHPNMPHQTGLAVRYAIVVFFLLLILAFFCFGYAHAQRRMRRGQDPLPYHRWLVGRRHYARYNSNYAPHDSYYQSGAVPMQNYAPPPPAYNQWDAPPQYQPPPGASKVMASQSVRPVGMDGEEGGHSSGPGLTYPPQSRSGPDAQPHH